MKCPKFILSLIFILSILMIKCAHQETSQDWKYLGQTPPGDTPEVFAPGIFSLSDRLESKTAFSPDGKECYFGVVEIQDNKASYKIHYSKYINNKWTELVETPFSGSNPFVSLDGKRIYFSRNGDIWMVERKLEGWGEPQLLPSPINSTFRESAYTETADGVVYIASNRPGGIGEGYDIWRILPSSDQSLIAENLGPIMNSDSYDVSPYIAPDESYLIFGSERNGNRGEAHLYISFNKGNDEWTIPVDMNSSGAEVNNETAHHANPSISPDGKFLFFRRHEEGMVMDLYWVNATIIDEIKERVLNPIKQFPVLKGDYLGQTPPGDTPVVFAPVFKNLAQIEILNLNLQHPN